MCSPTTAWGRGLATEATAAVFDAAREIDDVARFWATCDVDNRASARVLEKLGMREEGVLRRWSERPNHPGASGPRGARRGCCARWTGARRRSSR